MAPEDVPPLLAKSVSPIFFFDEYDRPEREGTCVLVTVLGCPVIATAAHVLRYVGTQQILVMSPTQKRLVSLGAAAEYYSDDEDDPHGLDVGFIPCNPQHVSTLEAAGFSFVPESALDTVRRPHDAEYVVFGWPESSGHSGIDHDGQHIDQYSFTFWTGEVPATRAQQAGENPDSHLVLEYPERIFELQTKQPREAFDPIGVSGGVAAYGNQANLGAIRIAGLMIRRHESHRVMVATRLSEFIGFVRDVRNSGHLQVGSY